MSGVTVYGVWDYCDYSFFFRRWLDGYERDMEGYEGASKLSKQAGKQASMEEPVEVSAPGGNIIWEVGCTSPVQTRD